MKHLFLLVSLLGWAVTGRAQVVRQVLHPTINRYSPGGIGPTDAAV